MLNSIRPTNPNQILKLATGLLFILVLGVVVPNESFACHREGIEHGPHLCGPPTPPPDTTDPTTLTPCPDGFMCLASVDKWDRPAARLYVEETFGPDGSYTQIPPNVFGNILAALSEGEFEFLDLCSAYDVLIFQWKSPGIKNLTWQSLVDYMACGGGVIFEDPSNVDALTDGVTTTNIYIRSNSTPPLTIAFEKSCFNDNHTLCEELPHGPEVLPLPHPGFTYEFDIENNHMEFAEDQHHTSSFGTQLTPFLRLPEGGPIIGLYGEYLNGGRIVITGPDNSFHGKVSTNDIDPLKEEHHNQLELLFHEIDWLLGF